MDNEVLVLRLIASSGHVWLWRHLLSHFSGTQASFPATSLVWYIAIYLPALTLTEMVGSSWAMSNSWRYGIVRFRTPRHAIYNPRSDSPQRALSVLSPRYIIICTSTIPRSQLTRIIIESLYNLYNLYYQHLLNRTLDQRYLSMSVLALGYALMFDALCFEIMQENIYVFQ